LLPGWILTIALQSFPITGSVPVSTQDEYISLQS